MYVTVKKMSVPLVTRSSSVIYKNLYDLVVSPKTDATCQGVNWTLMRFFVAFSGYAHPPFPVSWRLDVSN